MKANMQTFYALCYFIQAGDIHKKQPTTGDKEEVEPFAIYDTDLESHKKGKDSAPIVDVTYIEAETHEICKKKQTNKQKNKKQKKHSNLQEHNKYLKTNPTDCLYLLRKNLVKKNNLAW